LNVIIRPAQLLQASRQILLFCLCIFCIIKA